MQKISEPKSRTDPENKSKNAGDPRLSLHDDKAKEDKTGPDRRLIWRAEPNVPISRPDFEASDSARKEVETRCR